MKKVLSTLCILAVAFSLSAPAFAKQSKKSTQTSATETGKAHMKHSKKKGATAGQKQGQLGTAPATQK